MKNIVNNSGALQPPEGPQSGAHNYRARIEIRKTMRLSFHGHRGLRPGSRAHAPSDDDVAQNGGHTDKASPGHLTCLILTIHLSLKVTCRRIDCVKGDKIFAGCSTAGMKTCEEN